MDKERYPSFICIDESPGKLPEFTNEFISGLELKRSKTIMGYEQEIQSFEKEVISKNSSDDTTTTLLKNIHNNSSAFIPIVNKDNRRSRNSDNCILN